MVLRKELLVFLRKPEINSPVSLSFKESISLLLQCIPIYLFFIFICVLLFIPLSLFDLIPEMPKRSLSDTFKLIVLAPILEELFFRLPLRNFFRNIFFSGALLVYAFSKNYLGVPVAILFALLVSALPYLTDFGRRYGSRVDLFIHKYYLWFFYLVALVFGFIHMYNFDNLTTTQYLISPIIILYQILMALLLGFVRVKFKWGIIYAILVHSIFNSIPILFKLL